MRALALLLFFAAACDGDRGRFPPGSSPPVGGGTGTTGGASDGGLDAGPSGPDGGAPSGFECGSGRHACEFADGFANCCEDGFVECPPDYPYYCPADTLCWFDPELCVEHACSLRGEPCE
jgi:hypothetical protein